MIFEYGFFQILLADFQILLTDIIMHTYVKAKVCDISLSDHELILVTRQKGPNIKEECKFYGRS